MNFEHIAFIMDGNRRYAKKNGLSLQEGYKRGMEKFIHFVTLQVKYGIKETSFYALSKDNYEKRSIEELEEIFRLIQFFAGNKEIDQFFKENKIKVEIVGEISAMEKKEKKAPIGGRKQLIESLRKKYDMHNQIIGKEKFKVNIALNYDGQAEIVHAFKEISKKIASGELKENKITEKTIKEHIFFNGKEADVIVRSGNAPRLSGFMLWDSKYSEIYLTNKLWPELDETDFLRIIEWFNGIKRNFGV